MTRLKELWRRWAATPGGGDSQAYWRERFVSSEVSQAEIRREIFAKLKINLKFDSKLTAFRDWVARQDALDAEAEAMQDDEQRLQAEFGAEWTLDRIREEVLRRSYARALATGDFTSGRKTIVQDLNVKKVMLDERKVALLEKKAAAFDTAKGVMQNKELSDSEKQARMHELFGLR